MNLRSYYCDFTAKRVHEHHLWGSPAERLGEFLRNKPEVESLLVWVTFFACSANASA